MKMPTLLLAGAEIALITTAVLFLAFQDVWNTFIGVACVAAALVVVGWLMWAPHQISTDGRTVGVGIVRTVGNDESETAAGERQITIQVSGVHGETFIGRLVHRDGDPVVSWLRPGAVLLVAFDPAAREQLSLPDDMLAVRAADVLSM
jgi:hypothetical protein